MTESNSEFNIYNALQHGTRAIMSSCHQWNVTLDKGSCYKEGDHAAMISGLSRFVLRRLLAIQTYLADAAVDIRSKLFVPH